MKAALVHDWLTTEPTKRAAVFDSARFRREFKDYVEKAYHEYRQS
jgi:hypothetical protein